MMHDREFRVIAGSIGLILIMDGNASRVGPGRPASLWPSYLDTLKEANIDNHDASTLFHVTEHPNLI
jgi:hypothetical protein